MPVGFLTQEQRDGFGRYVDSPSREELERYFHLSDEDREAIQVLRGNHNRLGYAVLLTTVRFVGVLPDKPAAVPVEVLQVLCRQLAIPDPDCLQRYSDHRRWIHATDIQGVVCGRGRNPTLRLWPAIFSGEIDVFPSERRNMGQEIGR
ncbi:DUF4158 domain-containing protein [Pseudomonas aeruginosa]|uniref:DUF4158 domain-containing protein n=1 Tax=Pseudomonas aeruginosa TaxID=287 RepID=UPI00336B31BA